MPGVIDGRHWLRQRAAHLEGILATGDLSMEQRGPVEAELALVKSELGRRRGWRHWLLWGSRPVA